MVEGLYRISQQGQPLEVLAKTPEGKALTADYDLHLIGPHISDLGPQDNLLVPDVAHDVFKARINGYSDRATDSRPRNLAPELRQDYASAGSFYRKEDPDIGNATSRIAAMIPVINAALVGGGNGWFTTARTRVARPAKPLPTIRPRSSCRPGWGNLMKSV